MLGPTVTDGHARKLCHSAATSPTNNDKAQIADEDGEDDDDDEELKQR